MTRFSYSFFAKMSRQAVITANMKHEIYEQLESGITSATMSNMKEKIRMRAACAITNVQKQHRLADAAEILKEAQETLMAVKRENMIPLIAVTDAESIQETE